MSASFPNSWEPYGSSQQSQALAWRKPATRPAHQTFSQRWQAAHASTIRPIPTTPLKPLTQPPQPKPTPTPNLTPPAPSSDPKPQKKALDLASFRNSEHEHRILARYESVRAEVRDVVAVVKQLSDNLDQFTRTNDQTDKLLREDIASIHATLETVQEKLSKLPQENLTEQILKRVVAELITPLSDTIQNNSNTLNTLDESHTRLSARVNNMADGLFDRIANLVRHQLQNAFNTHFAPLLDRRIRTMFEQHRQTLDTLLARIEDRINLSIVPYIQQHQEPPSRSTDQDHHSLPDDSHFQSERDRYKSTPIQPFELREESLHRYESHPPIPQHDSHNCEKASDFNVTARDDASDAGPYPASGSALTEPAFDRAQTTAPRKTSTHEGSSFARAPSATPVWARLLIRPKKAPRKGNAAAKVPVIDLTKEVDSDVGEETNIFDDGLMQCKIEARQVSNNHDSSDSEVSAPLSDSSSDTDAEVWSPGGVRKSETENPCAQMSRGRRKSPYFTRGSKKRRRS